MFSLYIGLIILIIIFTLLGTLLFSSKNLSPKWIAVGSGDVTLAFSNDGKKWTGVNGLFGDNTIGEARSVFRSGDRWVVVGNDGDDEGVNIWWSDDAEVWNPAINNDDENDVFWGTDSTDTGLVVTSSNDFWLAGGNTGGDVNLYWSDDGKHWNEEEDGIFGGNIVNVIKKLNGLWLVGGTADSENQSVYWSEDGISWTAGTNAEGGRIFTDSGSAYDFAYHDGLWVVGGKNTGSENHIWWSEDGKEWNAVSTSIFGDGGAVYKIGYNNGKWVAVGYGTGTSAIAYSTDGKTWTGDTSIGNSEDSFTTLIYTDGYWITSGSDSSSNAQIYRSTNGIAWVESSFEVVGASADALAADKKMVVTGVVTDDDSLWYSEDTGSTWKEPDVNPFGVESQVYDIIYK